MNTCVALLRGINVGGHGVIAMAELRELLESLSLRRVQSLLQSGNLVFQTNADEKCGDLEARLEAETARRFRQSVDYLLRTADEWKLILKANPFSQEAERDPSHLLVMFLQAVPAASALASLKTALVGAEYFHSQGREMYLVYPDGIGRSKLTGALIEKKLGVRGTARNWNTVKKIAALL